MVKNVLINAQNYVSIFVSKTQRIIKTAMFLKIILQGSMALEKQNVLSSKEKALMRVIYNEADRKSGECVMSPIQIFEKIDLDLDFSPEELPECLKNLEIDDYFEMSENTESGNTVYEIKMHKRGLAFARVEKAFKANIKFKIGIALVCGLISGIGAWCIKLLMDQIAG